MPSWGLGDKEKLFKMWYSGWAKKLGLNPDPDDPQHHYDYRAAFNVGAKPDKQGHWPSEFKSDDHPNRYVIQNGQIIDTKTGMVIK